MIVQIEKMPADCSYKCRWEWNMGDPQSAKCAVNLICQDAKGMSNRLPKFLSVMAQNEIDRACKDVKAELDKAEQLAKRAERLTKDVENAILLRSFSRVSSETWAEIKQMVTEEAKKRTSKDSTSFPSAVDVTSLTRGSGTQKPFKLPVRIADKTEIHLLLNYNLDVSKGSAELLGAGVQMTYEQKDKISLKGAFLAEKEGNVGAYVTLGLNF
jgi:hypothetical protein